MAPPWETRIRSPNQLDGPVVVICGPTCKVLVPCCITLYRNIGILVHLDTGKTTTVEYTLYYTSTLHKISNGCSYSPAPRGTGAGTGCSPLSPLPGRWPGGAPPNGTHLDACHEVLESAHKGFVEVQFVHHSIQSNRRTPPASSVENPP